MAITTMRKVGGSLMLRIPPTLLKEIDLEAGTDVEISLTPDRSLIVRPVAPQYSLEQLLAECEGDFGHDEEDMAWIEAPKAGGELI